MKKYIAPNARCIILELEAMIAESTVTLNADYGDEDVYLSNRRNDENKKTIWDY